LLKDQEQIKQWHEGAFKSAYKALSTNSYIRKIYSTTLHASKTFKWKFKDSIHCYLLHGHYNGYYPLEGTLEQVCKPYFTPTYKYDASVDYQYSSISSPYHFGNFKITWDIKKTIYALLLLLVNPFALTTCLYHSCKTWMWQFGGFEIVPESMRPTKTLWYVYQALQK